MIWMVFFNRAHIHNLTMIRFQILHEPVRLIMNHYDKFWTGSKKVHFLNRYWTFNIQNVLVLWWDFNQVVAESGSFQHGKMWNMIPITICVQHSKFKAKKNSILKKTTFSVQHLVFFPTFGAHQRDHEMVPEILSQQFIINMIY